jgi:hypothetical protein
MKKNDWILGERCHAAIPKVDPTGLVDKPTRWSSGPAGNAADIGLRVHLMSKVMGWTLLAFLSVEMAGRSLLPKISIEDLAMNQTRTIGIDTAKWVFFLHGEDAGGKVILREKLTRERLLPFLANQPVSTIAIEAGCGAHHWARSFSKLGHRVLLIHAKFVRPFVKTNVRRILIQGAHSILRRIDQPGTAGPRTEWLRGLVARRGRQVAAVALANKNARVAWRLLRHETNYDETLAAAAWCPTMR